MITNNNNNNNTLSNASSSSNNSNNNNSGNNNNTNSNSNHRNNKRSKVEEVSDNEDEFSDAVSTPYDFLIDASKKVYFDCSQKYTRLIQVNNKITALSKIDSLGNLPPQLKLNDVTFVIPGAEPKKASSFQNLNEMKQALEKLQLDVLLQELKNQSDALKAQLDDSAIIKQFDNMVTSSQLALSKYMLIPVHFGDNFATMLAKTRTDLLSRFHRLVIRSAEKSLKDAIKKEEKEKKNDDAAMMVEETTTLDTINKIINKKVKEALSSASNSSNASSRHPSRGRSESRQQSSGTPGGSRDSRGRSHSQSQSPSRGRSYSSSHPRSSPGRDRSKSPSRSSRGTQSRSQSPARSRSASPSHSRSKSPSDRQQGNDHRASAMRNERDAEKKRATTQRHVQSARTYKHQHRSVSFNT